jgi:hypothetical protein
MQLTHNYSRVDAADQFQRLKIFFPEDTYMMGYMPWDDKAKGKGIQRALIGFSDEL